MMKKQLGDLIFDDLSRNVVFEQTGWARELVERVSMRLQGSRPRAQRLEVHVVWLDAFNAFTAPGRHIFISRQLLEKCRTEEMAAMVIGHEIAHHDLGHVQLTPSWMEKLMGEDLSFSLGVFYRSIEKRLHGPEKECDADRHGLELCLAAGYDGERCLELFDILESYALDRRALLEVFGPDESDDELLPDAPFKTRAKIWIFQRALGYLPIRDRRHMLAEHLAGRGQASPERPPSQPESVTTRLQGWVKTSATTFQRALSELG